MLQLIQEIDIINSDLYRKFNELDFPTKEMYLKCFTENYQNQKHQQNMQSNERQNRHQQQENKNSMIQVVNQRSTYKRAFSATTKARPLQPAELRFIKQVEEKINLYMQAIENNNEQFTIEYEDRQIKSQINTEQQSISLNQSTDQSYDHSDSFHETKKQKYPSGGQSFKLFPNKNRCVITTQHSEQYDVWQIIRDNNVYCKEDNHQKCDIVLKKKKSLVMILSLYQMMYKSKEDQWKTVLTFPYLTSVPQNSTIQYNYQIGEEEKNILLNGNCKLNSNIINAYINYLMIEDEKHHFSLGKPYRVNNKRLFIFGSEFITDCAIDDDHSNLSNQQLQQKHLYLWLKYLENFEIIQYQFWKIYKYIGFVVNKKNYHWYFLQVMFEKKTIVIFDSIRKHESCYYYIRDLLQYLFRKISKDESLIFEIKFAKGFPEQQDGLTCGYYSCIAAHSLNKRQLQNYLNLVDIQKILKELFLQKN